MDINIYLRKVGLIFCHAPVIFGFLTEFSLSKIGDIERLGRDKSRNALSNFTKRGMDIQGRSDDFLVTL